MNRPALSSDTGKPGWQVDGLLSCICHHPELDQRLRWQEQVSDEAFDMLYRHVTGALMGLQAQGFGPPLMEPARRGKSVLACGIPMVRKTSADAAHYFISGNDPGALAGAPSRWPSDITQPGPATFPSILWQTWADSARQPLACLPLGLPQYV